MSGVEIGIREAEFPHNHREVFCVDDRARRLAAFVLKDVNNLCAVRKTLGKFPFASHFAYVYPRRNQR